MSSILHPPVWRVSVRSRVTTGATYTRLRWNVFWTLLAWFLTLGLPPRSLAQLFGPGKFDRIELQITSGTSATGEKKSTIILNDLQGEFTITDSTFPNGQSFDYGTRFTGTLKFNFPANTPPVDAKSSLFNPPMSASLDLSGVWTGSPNITVVARGLLGKPSINASNCPQTPRVEVGPAVNKPLRMDIHSECSDIKTLDGWTGAMPKETLMVAHSLLTFDLGLFGSAGAEVEINVIYRAPWRPQITVSQAPLRFTYTDGQPLPPAQLLVVTNTGGLPLTWTAAATTTPPGGKWLKVNPRGDTLASNDRTPIEVSVDPTGLAPGDYTGTVTVDGDAFGGSKSISVGFKFVGVPKLTVTPASLEFFNRVELPEQTLTVKNEGSARLVWSSVATSDGNWLSTKPTGDELLPGQSKLVRVLAFAAGTPLNPGDYDGDIVFKPYQRPPGYPPNGDDFPPVSITARFHVLPPMDELSIQAGSVLPSTSEPIQLNTEYANFRADVTYRLGTRKDADLALRLFDEEGNLQASSDFKQVFKSVDSVTLKQLPLQKFKITPDAMGKVPSKLYLRAVLIDRSLLTPILKTPEADYIYEVPSIELLALEVTQVVQDWNHSVPLFDSKPTFVRAHLVTSSSKSQQLKLDKIGLHGTRNGTPLRGSPLSPHNESYPGLTVRPTTQFRRDVLEDGAYFVLPDDWVSGEVELRFEAAGVTCREATGTPNDCTVKVRFLPAPNLELKFINISWRNEHNETYEPNPGEMATERQRILALFPVRKNPRYYGETVLPYVDKGEPDLSTVANLVAEQRFRDGCGAGCNTIYFGLVEGLSPGAFLSNDNAYIPFVAAGGIPQGDPYSFQRHLSSHRLAHVLGLADAVHGSLGLDAQGRKRGWCDELAPASSPNFPEFAEINGHTYPTLGPMNSGSDQLVFGVEASNLASVRKDDATSILDLKLVNPTNTFELMSYCGRAATGPGKFGWPSKYTYEALAEKLRTLSQPALQALSTPRSYLLISGVINWKQQTAMLNPIGAVTTASPPVPPAAGDYALELRDDAGQVLLTVSFQPPGLANGAVLDAPESVPFFIPLPADPAVRKVTLLHAATTLTTRSASPNAPTVQLQFPKGGDTVSADPVTLRWQGHDADGDKLVYDVQFSPDGGATWQTIALRWPSESYDVSQRYFSATENGLIRVTASDGFNTATDTSTGAFTVPNHKPVVSLHSPKPNSLYLGAQQIFFQAGVLDPDGPEIDEAKIEWRSSLDGVLGTGSSLQRSATTLREGTHAISITVTDGDGAATTASVNIAVARVALAELAELGLSSPNGTVNAVVGDDLNFDFTIANHGPNTATGVNVTNTLPAGVRFVDAKLSQGRFTQTGQSVVCLLGDLAAGTEATATIRAKAAGQGTGSFVATVTGAGVDPIPTNNRIEIATTITRPSGTLVADYQFQNTLNSSDTGAPELTPIGAGSSFALETVDGLPRPVLRFAQGNGLRLSAFSSLVTGNAYSVVVLFRFETVSGYRRLLDFKNGVGEAGCYIADRQLFFYLFNSVGSEKTIEPNSWAQVVVTRAADGTVTGYHNGGLRLTFKDDAGVMLHADDDTLRFFKDNGDEESAGAVARIRLYDTTLTAAEVAALDRLPLPPGPIGITAMRSGNKITLSWSAKVAGFQLQATADLRPSAVWVNASTAPTTNGDTKSVTLDAADAARFFRLILTQ